MPDRRSVLMSLATAAAFTSAANTGAHAIGAPKRLMLWPDYPPGGGGPHGGVARDASGAVSNVAMPWLDVFQPENPNGVAVLVTGGGGYTRIGIVKEAYPAAFWLTSEGITAFVMTYRLPREGWDDGPVVPLQDAQRALRLIRANARQFRIDPSRIGVMGFSAGGHLAGMTAARHDFRSYPRIDAIDDVSARPDFSTLLYPVVSMQPPFDRTTTRRSLVGEEPTPAAAEEWSIQTYVKAGNPTTFLVQADDDKVISPEHSCVLDEVCRGAGVPIEYHRFARGGHGFGVGRSDAPVALWPKLCRLWLSSVSVLT
jgi:acetyl esterase/lipase